MRVLLRPLRSPLFLLALALATPASAQPDADGPLELRSEQALSARLRELRVFSPALARETSLRVLVPEDYDPSGPRLPVLWLLHGGFGSHLDWTVAGDAEAITDGLDLIVVMPDAGQGGWYSDWRTVETSQGFQRWETYHVRELRPFVHARYRARTDRAGNGMAGLSMGGFGALHHAARHPDLYGFAAAFSGAVDLLHEGVRIIANVSPLIMGGLPGDIWGDPVLEETSWRANNPVDLAANLATVVVELRTGNGQPGGVHGGGPDATEEGVSQATATLHERLAALGIPHLYDDYGPGAHTWPYWQDALRASLPGFLATALLGAPPPAHVEHLAFEPSFSAWGFDVALARPALERAVLTVRPDGFALRGTGAGTVTTPPLYAPGRRVRVLVHASGGARTLHVLRAGADGRLAVPVDLGPASTVDESARPAGDPPAFATVRVELPRMHPPVAAGDLRRLGHGHGRQAARR